MNHQVIQESIASLNPEQYRAVTRYDRPILVMAPVGTGKTNVVALRAANALAGGIPARRMLCLSFTNKAAREMQSRLVGLLGKQAAEITARTFHALCASILRMDSARLGLDSDFLIYDEDDGWQINGSVVARPAASRYPAKMSTASTRCCFRRPGNIA